MDGNSGMLPHTHESSATARSMAKRDDYCGRRSLHHQKIEGFFEICQARGLTGEQGVLIPRSNVQHLMLRAEVVEAVRAGQFHIWAVTTIDEGIELLMGVPAGARQFDGHFADGTVNRRVDQRLREFAACMIAITEPKDAEHALVI